MKIKVIQCPLCCMELPVEIFLHHMASDHNIEAGSIREINDRLKNVGFPNIEIYETVGFLDIEICETDNSEEKQFFV